jgi:two-component system, sensor histidine kinase PdtaS
VVSSHPIVITTTGDLGEVTADVATPLAVGLAELLQNAVEHAFDPETGGAEGSGGPGVAEESAGEATEATVGHVNVALSNDGVQLVVAVRDDGRGLPEGFDIEKTTSLGLSIVRDLVASQLEGRIAMDAVPKAEGGGTRVVITVPVRAPR